MFFLKNVVLLAIANGIYSQSCEFFNTSIIREIAIGLDRSDIGMTLLSSVRCSSLSVCYAQCLSTENCNYIMFNRFTVDYLYNIDFNRNPMNSLNLVFNFLYNSHICMRPTQQPNTENTAMTTAATRASQGNCTFFSVDVIAVIINGTNTSELGITKLATVNCLNDQDCITRCLNFNGSLPCTYILHSNFNEDSLYNIDFTATPIDSFEMTRNFAYNSYICDIPMRDKPSSTETTTEDSSTTTTSNAGDCSFTNLISNAFDTNSAAQNPCPSTNCTDPCTCMVPDSSSPRILSSTCSDRIAITDTSGNCVVKHVQASVRLMCTSGSLSATNFIDDADFPAAPDPTPNVARIECAQFNQGSDPQFSCHNETEVNHSTTTMLPSAEAENITEMPNYCSFTNLISNAFATSTAQEDPCPSTNCADSCSCMALDGSSPGFRSAACSDHIAITDTSGNCVVKHIRTSISLKCNNGSLSATNFFDDADFPAAPDPTPNVARIECARFNQRSDPQFSCPNETETTPLTTTMFSVTVTPSNCSFTNQISGAFAPSSAQQDPCSSSNCMDTCTCTTSDSSSPSFLSSTCSDRIAITDTSGNCIVKHVRGSISLSCISGSLSATNFLNDTDFPADPDPLTDVANIACAKFNGMSNPQFACPNVSQPAQSTTVLPTTTLSPSDTCMFTSRISNAFVAASAQQNPCISNDCTNSCTCNVLDGSSPAFFSSRCSDHIAITDTSGNCVVKHIRGSIILTCSGTLSAMNFLNDPNFPAAPEPFPNVADIACAEFMLGSNPQFACPAVNESTSPTTMTSSSMEPSSSTCSFTNEISNAFVSSSAQEDPCSSSSCMAPDGSSPSYLSSSCSEHIAITDTSGNCVVKHVLGFIRLRCNNETISATNFFDDPNFPAAPDPFPNVASIACAQSVFGSNPAFSCPTTNQSSASTDSPSSTTESLTNTCSFINEISNAFVSSSAQEDPCSSSNCTCSCTAPIGSNPSYFSSSCSEHIAITDTSGNCVVKHVLGSIRLQCSNETLSATNFFDDPNFPAAPNPFPDVARIECAKFMFGSSPAFSCPNDNQASTMSPSLSSLSDSTTQSSSSNCTFRFNRMLPISGPVDSCSRSSCTTSLCPCTLADSSSVQFQSGPCSERIAITDSLGSCVVRHTFGFLSLTCNSGSLDASNFVNSSLPDVVDVEEIQCASLISFFPRIFVCPSTSL